MKQINKQELHVLFEKIKNKEDGALDELYKKYSKLIINISFSIVKNREIAEEVLQTIFLKLIQLSPEKIPTKNEFSWLYTVTKNESIQYLRKNNTYVNLDDIYNVEDNNNEIENITNRDSYNKLISKLNNTEKEIVSLKVLSGFTFKEIGQILNIPTGTVQWKYYKSIHTLKLLLGNIVMFIFTFILYVHQNFQRKDIGQMHEATNIDNSTQGIIESSINSYIASGSSPASETSISIINFILIVALITFFIFTIIFLINYIKHQQNRHKKTSN